MSIGVVTTTQDRRGYGPISSDKRDPVGIWFKQLLQAGDASGGVIDFQNSFSKNQVFSVQGVRFTVTNLTVTEVTLNWFPGLSADFELLYSLALVTQSPGTGNALRPQNELMDWLPHSWPAPTAPFPLFRMEADNVNGAVYSTSQWGYVWDLAALRLPGGPRRPLAN